MDNEVLEHAYIPNSYIPIYNTSTETRIVNFMNSICELEKHTWKTKRDDIKAIFPAFASVIDELSPPDKYPLYVARYPYGAMILDKGVFQIPNAERHLVPLNHSSISNNVKTELGYSGTIPLGLITKNHIESFVQLKHRVLPATFMGVGNLVSLWRVLDEIKSYYVGHFWNISSGARSICMLPKVTDSAGHKNLKTKYGLKLPIPQKLNDHWDIFTHIANHTNFSQPWHSELIFFSNKWFEHKEDKAWCNFYRFLLNEVWQKSSFKRNQFIFDSAFSIAQENKNLRPNPYLADTVKHLIAVGSGSAPAFTSAIDDTGAPISGLQKVYLEDYGLKKYAPILMHLRHFSANESKPVYYSLQIPNTTIFSPKSRKLSSMMTDLHELKHIMETLLSEIIKGNLGVEETPLFDLAKNTRYSYYHSDKDKLDEILLANDIAKLDSSFTHSLINNVEYGFPEFAPFFRGCIAVSNVPQNQGDL